jgi:hypothetical protein
MDGLPCDSNTGQGPGSTLTGGLHAVSIKNSELRHKQASISCRIITLHQQPDTDTLLKPDTLLKLKRPWGR